MFLERGSGAFAVVLSVTVFAAACSGLMAIDGSQLEGAACIGSDNCPPGQICRAGICRWSPSCETAVDCGSWEICVLDLCAPSPGTCSTRVMSGHCPEERLCDRGVCIIAPDVVRNEPQTWCACEPDQGCSGGECVSVKPETECSPAHTTGACPNGDVCAGGGCIPITEQNSCSFQRPGGVCPDGAACKDGFCIPIDDQPCAGQDLDGLCPAGKACIPPGNCRVVNCSDEYPQGSCYRPDQDRMCIDGTCEQLPCGPNRTKGFCDDGQFCSAIGACLENGRCGLDGDCGAGSFCSEQGICILESTCLTSGDCPAFHLCHDESCVRDFRCEDDDGCPDAEFCSAKIICDSANVCSRACLLDGVCFANEDCGAGQFCAAAATCIDDGTCLDQRDCTTGMSCGSAHKCLAPGECDASGDCPPGHSCQGRSCAVAGTLCVGRTTEGCEETSCCPAAGPGNPDGLPCCGAGEVCSDAGSCIYAGQCTANEDCPPAYRCGADYTCLPVVACDTSGSCPVGQRCSLDGGCISDDPGACVLDLDCSDGYFCNELFTCELDDSCGSQEFQASLVEPNMLVVFDRSGSMNWCVGSAQGDVGVTDPSNTRWNVSRNALAEVLDEHQGGVRFGLSTYPKMGTNPEEDPGCGTPDDTAFTCADDNNKTCDGRCGPACKDAGARDVPIAIDNSAAIQASLAPPDQHPGGWTPTGKTLRSIGANLGHFGLPDPADAAPRDNYVLLFTDGNANQDDGELAGVCKHLGDDAFCSVSVDCEAWTECTRNSSGDCVAATFGDNDAFGRVNCALKHLGRQSPPVRTYVVGFIGGSPGWLNCHAAWGGTSRCATEEASCTPLTAAGRDACNDAGCRWCESGQSDCSWLSHEEHTCVAPVTENNACETDQVDCYYPATKHDELVDVFGNIAGEVASCTYSLTEKPQQISRLFVLLQYDCADRETSETCAELEGCAWAAGSCTGTADPVKVERGAVNGWQYDSGGASTDAKLTFNGISCDDVRSGLASPKVVYGCLIGGG